MTHHHPVLVIGGTRGTGLLIARQLSQQGRPVQVLARNPVHAAKLLGPMIHIVPGDITREGTLPPALRSVGHVVFTAGCRSGRPVGEAQIIATEYRGVLNTLAAAQRTGFAGRFLYMTASGTMRRSLAAIALNLYKGNTLIWRRRAEAAIRASDLDYTIIRAGVLLNRPGGQRAIRLTQEALPLSPRYRIARADVAEAFVAALDHPKTKRTTFEIVWGPGTRREAWSGLFQGLIPDNGR
jgi:uncharacterized protein YbjT (DUF2867 family)